MYVIIASSSCKSSVATGHNFLSKLRLGFAARATQVLVASFLPTSSVLALSTVDHSTHRRFFSRDFDETFWRHRCCPDISLITLLQPSRHIRFMGDVLSETYQGDLHMSFRATDKEDTEKVVVSSTYGCHWRLEFIEKVAIPAKLPCALFFLRYPLVSLVSASSSGAAAHGGAAAAVPAELPLALRGARRRRGPVGDDGSDSLPAVREQRDPAPARHPAGNPGHDADGGGLPAEHDAVLAVGFARVPRERGNHDAADASAQRLLEPEVEEGGRRDAELW